MYNIQGDPGAYRHILHCVRPAPQLHVPMSRLRRAAQFAPFDALTGYGAAIREMARRTEPKRDLTEEEKLLLNRKLLRLQDGMTVTVCYFRPDDRKDGGAYLQVTGIVCKLKHGALYLADGTEISLDCLHQLEIHAPEYFSDSCADFDLFV